MFEQFRSLIIAGFACSWLLACGSDSGGNASAAGGGGGSSTRGGSTGAAATSGGAGAAALGGSATAGATAAGNGNEGGAGAGLGGTNAAGVSGASSNAGSSGSAGSGGASGNGSSKVLIYGVTTGFRHTSITAAANALKAAAETHGLSADLVGCTDATNRVDATKFSSDALASYGAVVLLANTGEPFGYPAETEVKNLIDYVQQGGALVAIENADHSYDGGFNGHAAYDNYVSLIGNDFVGHPGGVALATCTKVGTGPTIDALPATFTTTDEIYETKDLNPANQVVLTCVSSADPAKAVRPISYVRDEGKGRMFFTALGHLDESWTAPLDAAAANSRLVEDHVIPALLWTMRR